MLATILDVEVLDDARLMVTAEFADGERVETYSFPVDRAEDVPALLAAEAEVYAARFAAAAQAREVALPPEAAALIGHRVQT